MPIIKISYGIACFRWNPHINETQLLMVKKKYTNRFADFIYGNYDMNNLQSISDMLNNISSIEKSLILSEDFGKMWYHMFNIDPQCQDVPYTILLFFQRKKQLFNKKISRLQYHVLRNMIHNSHICESNWEIPKGRVDAGEMPMNCAIREFQEETGISPLDYNIRGCSTNTYSTSHLNIVYTREYYTATTNINIRYPHQVNYSEIENVRWMTKQDIINCDRNPNKILSNFTSILFAHVKKYKLSIYHNKQTL